MIYPLDKIRKKKTSISTFVKKKLIYNEIMALRDQVMKPVREMNELDAMEEQSLADVAMDLDLSGMGSEELDEMMEDVEDESEID